MGLRETVPILSIFQTPHKVVGVQVVSPQIDGEMGHFGQWLGLTHTQRYHAHYHTTGDGHLYQGRYKSFPVTLD